MTKKSSPSSKKVNRGTAPPRMQAVMVKTAAKRSTSSTRWLKRQLNDPYVVAAKRDGYRSRAAYKLLELDDRYGLLRHGLRVVDLGAAPGGWAQVVLKRVSQSRLVALDLLPIAPLPPAIILQADFMDEDTPARLIAALAGRADLVLSDMAAPTTGHQATDHLRIMALAEAAYEFAAQILAPDGAFVCKLFQGGAEKTLRDRLKQDFSSLRHAKPPASRQDSAETYLVAQGFRASIDDREA
jgi:23S rRNA (uridine2552-2'-O)-methyltransferase